MTSPDLQPVLLRTVVGSKAHGLARPDSDTDYREVFIIPTSEMLALGRDRLKFAWQTNTRHTDDEGGYEISEFLHLVSKGSVNATEILFAPRDPDWTPDFAILLADGTTRPIADELRVFGTMLLSRKAVQESTIGYALNAFRKVQENPGKWKTGMLRVLYQGRDLIQTGEMSLEVPERGWGQTVRMAGAVPGYMTEGEALDIAHGIIAEIKEGPSALPETGDFTTVNKWLLALRREVW